MDWVAIGMALGLSVVDAAAVGSGVGDGVLLGRKGTAVTEGIDVGEVEGTVVGIFVGYKDCWRAEDGSADGGGVLDQT